jgi:PIN domain nuclease of toxin-antitoxin system
LSNFVLDSSALIAVLDSEPGAAEVASLIEPGCFLSTVNLAETVAHLRRLGWPDREIEAGLASFDVEVVEFSRQQAFDVGILRELTREQGLSLGDRACLALARELRLPALTGDRVWAAVDVGVSVVLFR